VGSSAGGVLARAAGWLTPARTMVAGTFLVVFMLGAQLRVDTDVWWHLRAGAVTLDHGVIRSDPFSFTMRGHPWMDHSWGGEVLSYLVWRVGGYGALEVLTGLLALVGSLFVYAVASGGTYLRCLGVGLAAVTASIFWTPRPQMFSFALTALVVYLPVVLLVWANLHGAFAIGLALMAVTLLGELLEHAAPLDARGSLETRGLVRLAFALGASVVAVCLNPYGFRLLAVPFETSSGSFSELIEEWMPPDLHNPSFWPFAILVVVLVFAVGTSPVALGWTDALLVGGSLLMAISAARNISTFAVVVTPILTYHADALLRARGHAVRKMAIASFPIAASNVLILALLAGVAASRISPAFTDATFAERARETLPVDATAYLKANGVRGRLFNDYAWGGYLIEELRRTPVFVDGRSDLYGSDFLRDPYEFIAGGGPGWQARLDDYSIGTVIVPRTAGLAAVLAGSAEWKWVYADRVAVVFERRQAVAGIGL
jgi:hypothetical protein